MKTKSQAAKKATTKFSKKDLLLLECLSALSNSLNLVVLQILTIGEITPEQRKMFDYVLEFAKKDTCGRTLLARFQQ